MCCGMGLFWTFSQISCLSVCLFICSSAMYLALSDPDINANSEASRVELNELQIATNAEFSPSPCQQQPLVSLNPLCWRECVDTCEWCDSWWSCRLQWSVELAECETRQDKANTRTPGSLYVMLTVYSNRGITGSRHLAQPQIENHNWVRSITVYDRTH